MSDAALLAQLSQALAQVGQVPATSAAVAATALGGTPAHDLTSQPATVIVRAADTDVGASVADLVAEQRYRELTRDGRSNGSTREGIRELPGRFGRGRTLRRRG